MLEYLIMFFIVLSGVSLTISTFYVLREDTAPALLSVFIAIVSSVCGVLVRFMVYPSAPNF